MKNSFNQDKLKLQWLLIHWDISVNRLSSNPGPGRDASPSQVMQVSLTIHRYQFTLLDEERHCESIYKVSSLAKNTTQWPRPALKPGPLDPDSNAQTIRPPRLPQNPFGDQSNIAQLSLD